MAKIAWVRSDLKSLDLTIIPLACPTTCSECTSDTVCTKCKATYGLQNDQCAQCPSATYLSGQDCIGKSAFKGLKLTTLLACPNNCSTCTSDTICTNCLPNNGLQNNQCAPCPAGTYLNGQNCVSNKLFWTLEAYSHLLACPNTCETCTSGTICQQCKPNYGLQSNMCSTCPAGTYLSAPQTCVSKKPFLENSSLNLSSLSNYLCYLLQWHPLFDL